MPALAIYLGRQAAITIAACALLAAPVAFAADRHEPRAPAPVPTVQIYHAVSPGGVDTPADLPIASRLMPLYFDLFGDASSYGDGPRCAIVRSRELPLTSGEFFRVAGSC